MISFNHKPICVLSTETSMEFMLCRQLLPKIFCFYFFEVRPFKTHFHIYISVYGFIFSGLKCNMVQNKNDKKNRFRHFFRDCLEVSNLATLDIMRTLGHFARLKKLYLHYHGLRSNKLPVFHNVKFLEPDEFANLWVFGVL